MLLLLLFLSCKALSRRDLSSYPQQLFKQALSLPISLLHRDPGPYTRGHCPAAVSVHASRQGRARGEDVAHLDRRGRVAGAFGGQGPSRRRRAQLQGLKPQGDAAIWAVVQQGQACFQRNQGVVPINTVKFGSQNLIQLDGDQSQFIRFYCLCRMLKGGGAKTCHRP